MSVAHQIAFYEVTIIIYISNKRTQCDKRRNSTYSHFIILHVDVDMIDVSLVSMSHLVAKFIVYLLFSLTHNSRVNNV